MSNIDQPLTLELMIQRLGPVERRMHQDDYLGVVNGTCSSIYSWFIELRDELGFVSVAGDDFLARDNVQIIRKISDRSLSLAIADVDGEQVVLAKKLTRGLIVSTLRLVAECSALTALYTAGKAALRPTTTLLT